MNVRRSLLTALLGWAAFASVAAAQTQVTITTTSLPNGLQGINYSQPLTAANGSGTYMWDQPSGTLPPGLAVDSGGSIFGDPSQTGTFSFTVRVTDIGADTSVPPTASQTLTITIDQNLTITTGSALPAGLVNSNYAVTLVATATGAKPPFNWFTNEGSFLPPGMTLNSTTGVLAGAPTATGSYSFTITVSTLLGNYLLTDQRTFSLAVVPPVVITTTSLPAATQALSYSQPLQATGGSGSYSWSFASGTLPPGLSVGSGGVLSGIPSQIGTFNFSVTAFDNLVPSQATQALSVTVNANLRITSTSPLTAGFVQAPYSNQLTATATGVSPPFTWFTSAGTLPPGLNLNSTTGVLAGTPTQTGTFNFTVTVSTALNGVALTDQRAFSLTIGAGVTITTTSLPTATQAVSYSQTLRATGGTGSFTWLVTAGALPPGLSVNSGGAVSGIPSQIGTFNFSVTATDTGSGGQATQALSITVNANLRITSTSPLTTGFVQASYSNQLTATATGVSPPFTWFTSAGTLPSGLNLNSATGVLAGTPTQTGTFNFTVTVSTALNGVALTDQRAFSLTIGAGVAITTTSLPAATQAVSYSQTLHATGGTGTFSWLVTSGALPPGLSLNSGGGVSGIPSQIGTFSFSVTASDTGSGGQATQALSITVNANLRITSTSPLTSGFVKTSYSVQVTATATGVSPPFTWLTSAGTLPPGLNLNSTTGILAGTPTQAGTFNFTVTVSTTLNGVTLTDQRAFSVSISAGVGITTTSLPAATQALSYSQTLLAAGGSGTFSWSVTSGALPPGLSLSSGGVISGIPSQTGAFSFSVTASDLRIANTATQALSITVNPNLRITTTALLDGQQNAQYQFQLTATGGSGQYQWSLTGGSLPPGIGLGANGLLTGSSATLGAFSFTVTVTSTLNNIALVDQRTFTLNIALPALTVTSTSLPGGVPHVAYSFQLTATGGVAPYTWSFSLGSLPAGLTLSPGGLISGTPAAESNTNLIFRVQDSGQGSTFGPLMNLVIAFAPVTVTGPLTAGTLPAGTLNVPYTTAVQASGGNGSYTFSVTSGSLPPGLSLATSGTITGTPTTVGAFPVTIQAKDTSGKSGSTPFTIVIKPLGVTPSSLPSGVVGVSYLTSLNGIGGTPPYTFTATGVPSGLSLAPTGQISGKPAVKGTFLISVTITDKAGASATAPVTITINSSTTGGGVALGIGGPVPDQTSGVAAKGGLAVTGGSPPYVCTLVSGALPSGVVLNSDCSFGGTPAKPGTSSFTAQATDQAAGVATSPALTMRVVAPPIVIGIPGTLPPGTVGGVYTQTFTATGGSGPLSWSVGTGLPGGLTLSSTGVLSGTTTSLGTFTFTVTAKDGFGTTSSTQVSLTFSLPPAPAANFAGLGGTADPVTQPVFQIDTSTAYPVAISGTLTLSFKGDDGSDDPMVQFSTGGRSLAFTVPANATVATFSTPNVALATGTTAGVITVTMRLEALGQDITSNPAPTQTIRIAPLAPAISSVTASRSGTTVTVVVTGFATSKQVTSAAFTFNPAAGSNFQSTTLTETVGSTFTAYYASAAASGFGSQYTFTQTFNVTGDPAAIASVSVVLTNSTGSSTAATASLQ